MKENHAQHLRFPAALLRLQVTFKIISENNIFVSAVPEFKRLWNLSFFIVSVGSPEWHAVAGSLLKMENFVLSFAPTHIEASKGGDLGFSHGTYTATLTDPKTGKPAIESGKYVCLYRRQADGAWKAILDVDNPDAPAK